MGLWSSRWFLWWLFLLFLVWQLWFSRPSSKLCDELHLPYLWTAGTRTGLTPSENGMGITMSIQNTMYVHTHTHTHACTHVHTHTHTCAHAHTHTHTHMHTHTHAHMHTHMHTHTRTHTHAHTRTHAHTHTHTHTYLSSLSAGSYGSYVGLPLLAYSGGVDMCVRSCLSFSSFLSLRAFFPYKEITMATKEK